MAKSPAWQRKAGKSKSGGLNAKGRASIVTNFISYETFNRSNKKTMAVPKSKPKTMAAPMTLPKSKPQRTKMGNKVEWIFR